MKQYVIDEIRPEDYQKFKAYLDDNFSAPGFDGLYWLPLDGKVYDAIQKQHADCQPFYFALELMPERLACELLVRTNKRMKCQCIQYATQDQRNWLIQTVDAMADRLGIVT